MVLLRRSSSADEMALKDRSLGVLATSIESLIVIKFVGACLTPFVECRLGKEPTILLSLRVFNSRDISLFLSRTSSIS